MKTTLLAASCSFDINATPEHLLLIPEGTFKGVDGRPHDAPHWSLTPARGKQIVAALNSRAADTVIDYEHGTLYAKKGEPVPAAGWLKSASFIYIDGVGICSTQFEWTDKAGNFIASEEYKYISPLFFYKPDGEIVSMINIGLTNTPNLPDPPEAKLAAAARELITQFSITQDSEMNEELLKQVRYLLNLPLTTTADEAVAALEKLKNMLLDKTGISIAENSQSIYDVIAEFEQLKVAANAQQNTAVPDPAQYVPMAVYQEALNAASAATASAQTKEMDDLIAAACSDGRLTGEASINWIKSQAEINPEFVKVHLAGLPKIAALSQQQTSQMNFAKDPPKLENETENEVLNLLGVSKDDVEKYGK